MTSNMMVAPCIGWPLDSPGFIQDAVATIGPVSGYLGEDGPAPAEGKGGPLARWVLFVSWQIVILAALIGSDLRAERKLRQKIA